MTGKMEGNRSTNKQGQGQCKETEQIPFCVYLQHIHLSQSIRIFTKEAPLTSALAQMLCGPTLMRLNA